MNLCNVFIFIQDIVLHKKRELSYLYDSSLSLYASFTDSALSKIFIKSRVFANLLRKPFSSQMISPCQVEFCRKRTASTKLPSFP